MSFNTIAFQGERGAFSEEAAHQLLGSRIRAIPCETFAQVFASVAQGKAKMCLVPIENTLAGSVYENYDLLVSNRLHIVGEVNLRIVHNLIGFAETSRKNLRRVYSHPVALAQCGKFFEKHPGVEKVPFYDTAGSVKMLAERRIPGAAAIASLQAGVHYGLDVLAGDIEDNPGNLTRFAVIGDEPAPRTGSDRVASAKPTIVAAFHDRVQNGISLVMRRPLTT